MTGLESGRGLLKRAELIHSMTKYRGFGDCSRLSLGLISIQSRLSITPSLTALIRNSFDFSNEHSPPNPK